MMKKVFICCPDDAKIIMRYVKYALIKGAVPTVPFIYAKCIDEKEIALAAELADLWSCDELWVFDKVSEEMKLYLNFAKNLKIPQLHITKEEVNEEIASYERRNKHEA